MPATLARIAANRSNALKSTGPRSPEGKARSRENGLKHGLTGEGVVMDAESRSAVDARKLRLLEELAPSTSLGEILVERIAVLSVRLERSSRVDEACTTRRVREAPAEFDRAREFLEWEWSSQLARYGEAATDETPSSLFRKLCRTAGGIDQLVSRWRRLRHRVEVCTPKGKHDEPGGASRTVLAEHFDLLEGRFPDDITPSPAYAAALRLNGGDASTKPQLLRFIDDAIDRLEAARAAIDPAEVDDERREAAEMALFDPSKEGDLRRKYETRTESALLRAIRELRIAERPAKAEAVDEAPSLPEPEPKAPRPALTIADPDAPAFADVSASAAVDPAPGIPEATEEAVAADPPVEETFRQRRRREFAEYHAKLRAGEVPDYVPKWR